MTPAAQVSDDVWNRLKQSREFDVRLGEETLTDILTLDFTRLSGGHKVKIRQTEKHEEAQNGADLEIFVNIGGGSAFRYAVQAKKLYPEGKYRYLKAKAGKSGPFQLDVLEAAAKANGILPYYLLYNYVDRVNTDQHWHCCQSPDENQFGCTLVPSWRVRQAIDPPCCRTFKFLHSFPEALPFRCRFDCPRDARWDRKRETEGFRFESREYTNASREVPDWWKDLERRKHEWPEWLWRGENPQISMDDMRRLWTELRPNILETPLGVQHPREPSMRLLVPRRILLIGPDTGPDKPDRGRNEVLSPNGHGTSAATL